MFNTVNRKIALIIFLALSIYLAIHYVGQIISLVLPLLIALIISYKLRPLIKTLDDRTALPIGVISLLSILLSISFITLIVWSLVKSLIVGGSMLIAVLPEAIDELNRFYQSAIHSYNAYFKLIPTNWQGVVSNSIRTLTNQIGTVATAVGTRLMNGLTFLPNLLFFLIFTLLTSYFVTKDFERVDKFVQEIKLFFHKKILYQEIKKNVFLVLIGYLRAQLILMSITFLISLIGLLVLNVKYAPLVALIIALIDALPLFGPSIIYIPWIIARALLGNISGAIALLVLYLIVTLTRQTLEAKILSSQIGVHPIITLTAMYAGIKLFGLFGIILGPLSAISILKSYKILILSQKHEH